MQKFIIVNEVTNKEIIEFKSKEDHTVYQKAREIMKNLFHGRQVTGYYVTKA